MLNELIDYAMEMCKVSKQWGRFLYIDMENAQDLLLNEKGK